MRSGLAVLGAVVLASACSGGGAAATGDAFLPVPDAARADAAEVPDAGLPDASVPDAPPDSELDAGRRDAAVDGPVDAAVDGPAVHVPITGQITGMWDGASLTVRLQADGSDDQRLTLDANGTFSFPSELLEGTPFVASVEASPALHTCTVQNQRGRAWQGTPPVQITCAGPALQIELSNSDGFRFDTTTRSYDLAYSFLTREQLLRVAGDDRLDVQLDGSPAPVGAWSTFPLGDDPVTVRVHVGAAAASLAFQLTFRRGAHPLAQAVFAKSPFAGAIDEFGTQVAVSRDTLVGVTDAFDIGFVTVFRRTGAVWAFERILDTPEFTIDAFGASVAISGDTIVVGAPSSRRGAEGGAAFVYRRGFAGWLLEGALVASNADAGDGFGRSVAIDGDTIVVGAPREDSAATGVNAAAPGPDDNSQPESGAAYVFRRSGAVWTQEAYLKASNTGQDDDFGRKVAISGDTVAVSADGEDSAATGVNGSSPGQDDNSMSSAGAVYVFRRSSAGWAQEAYVKASNTGALDSFGDSVALWGETLVVGASGEDSAATGANGTAPGPDDNSKPSSGAAYVFVRTAGAWTQQAYLKASNTGAGDMFGRSVAVGPDAVVVGAANEDGGGRGSNPVAPGPDDESKLDSGAVYVFRHGTTWFQEAYLKSANSDAGDRFGSCVAIGPDTIAVGAPGEDSAFSGGPDDNSQLSTGAAYLFR